MSGTDKIEMTQKEYINIMAHKITHEVVSGVDLKIDKLKAKIDYKIDNLKSEMDANKVELKSEMDANKVELKAEMNSNKVELKSDMRRLESKVDSHFKWIMGTIIIGIMVPMLGVIATGSLKLVH